MKDIVQTEAIVLRSRNYKEADQLITFYTRKYGKITAIAKGVKKPKSKLRGAVQVFSHSNLSLFFGRNLGTITQGESINTFLELRSDFTRMSYASYIAELIDSVIPESQNDEEIFRLLLEGQYLLSFADPLFTTHLIEARLLAHLGYQPQLDFCVECGEKIKNDFFFVPILGGAICSKCKKNSLHAALKISGEAKSVLMRLVDMDILKVTRIKISESASREIDKLLDTYITHILGKKLKSKQFLNNVL